MAFENLIGNEKVKNILINSIQTNKITHSYLFIGTSGIGKSLFAKEFAKLILEKNTENSDSKLEHATEENIPDLKLIEQEEGKIKIEQIRALQEKISEKPIISNKKIYIINNADTMTKEAQNCLLKTLEEPPEYAILILIATSESAILSTIKSRCMKILFQPIEQETLKQCLEKQDIQVTPVLLEISQGSIEKALKLYKYSDKFAKIEEVFSNIENKQLLDVLNKIEGLYDKENINDILEYINIILYKKAKANVGTALANTYCDYMKEIENVKNNLKLNCNYDMTIDNLLYNIWKE